MASAIDEDEIVNDQTLGAVKLEVDSDLQFGEMMHKTRLNKALKVFSSKHMETILEDVDQEEEAEDAVIIASLGAGHDPGESGGQADKGPPDCGPPRSHPSHCDLPDPPPDPPDPPGHLAAPAGEISMPPLGQTWWREFQSNLCALKLRFDHIARCDQVGGQDGANLTLLQRKATLDVVLVNWKDSKQLQCQTVKVDYRHRQIFSMPMVNKWFDFHEPSWDLLVPDIGQRNSKLKGKDRLQLPDRIFRIKTVYEQASKNITLSELGEAHEGMSSEPCSHCSSWTDSAGAASAITCALCGQTAHPLCAHALLSSLADAGIFPVAPEYTCEVMPHCVRHDYRSVLCSWCSQSIADVLERHADC